VKSIIVYTRQLKAQNLYPKRIISPPTPSKCCPTRMEVLGRPRVDQQGRRFCYKRCRVCGFALRYFLEPVPSIVTPESQEPKVRKPLSAKERPASAPAHSPIRRPRAVPRKPAPSRHVRRHPPSRGPHVETGGRRRGSRRRR